MVADDIAARSPLARRRRRAGRRATRNDLHRVQHGHGGLGARTGGRRADRDCELLDAPVTGSKIHAAARRIEFSGRRDPADDGKGPPGSCRHGQERSRRWARSGSGALIKLINNFVCGMQVAALAEALAMIERSGLDRAKALEVLTNGAPGSPLVKTVAARMTNAGLHAEFSRCGSWPRISATQSGRRQAVNRVD